MLFSCCFPPGWNRPVHGAVLMVSEADHPRQEIV